MEPQPTVRFLPAPAERGGGLLGRLDTQELVAIFAGGFVGALARAALAQSLAVSPGSWPWATFGVNLAGAAMLGYFITRLQERLPPSLYRRSFLGTGICGALTTFSTMMVELLRMLDGSHWGLALGYSAASIAGGLAAVFVATKLVRRARSAP
ncbi:MAG: fluoride efflux transporter CrcB [Solirubrobacteraceae bacterium]